MTHTEMSLTTELENPTRDEELARLARTLRLVRGFRLYFARCAAGELRRQIFTELAEAIPGRVEIYEVEPGLESLRFALEQRIDGAEPPAVIFVTGIETWIPAGDEGAGSMFIRNLNASRDVFGKVLPCPMVVWAADHVLRSIQHGAPDFFSGASGIYLFPESVGGPAISRGAEPLRLEGSARWIRELAEVDERLEAIGSEPVGTAIVDQIDLLNRRVGLLIRLARFSEAEPDAELAYALASHRLGAKHAVTLASMTNLADLYYLQSRYSDAEPLLRQVLSIEGETIGRDHTITGAALNNLARLLMATNRLVEAEPLLRHALAIDEKIFGQEHPDVAVALGNLARLLKDTNRISEAEPLMRKALAIDEQHFGKNHPTVALRLANLADLLYDANRLAEAEPLMREAISIDEQCLGKDHPSFARDLNNLAQLLRATNRLAEAEPLLRQALAIDERSFGSDHPEVAIDLHNLAGLLQTTERLAEAEPLMRRAVAIFERSLGPNHPNTKYAAMNLHRMLDESTR